MLLGCISVVDIVVQRHNFFLKMYCCEVFSSRPKMAAPLNPFLGRHSFSIPESIT